MGYFNVKVKPKRGEVYWIEKNSWKDNNLEIQQKERPGVIVSSDDLNGKGKTYEIVYLTTNPKNDEKTHCTIRSTAKVSTALCENITTVNEEQLGICLGKCTPEEMATIDACLQISLGLETKETKKTLTTGQFSVTTKAGPPTTIKLPQTSSTETTEISTGKRSDKEIIHNLQTELAKTQGKAELPLTMYNELLAKTLKRKEFDNTEKNL